MLLFEAQEQARGELAKSRDAAEQWLSRRAKREFEAIREGVRKRHQLEAYARREQRSRDAAQRRYRWRRHKPQYVRLDWDYGRDGGSLHEVIGSVEDDPFTILTGTSADHINELLGDLAIEDLARMDEWQLEGLRERIREAGLAPSSVQRSERERLNRSARHRGGAPPPTRGRMSTKQKHRKPGHKSSAGGQRSAKKPKPRWTREAA